MRLLITIAVVTLALSCYARPADDDYVYEDDTPAEPAPAPAPKAPPARHALIGSRTARGPSPLIGSRGKTTTTAAPKPAEPEVENEPEGVEEEAGEEVEEAAPVTTEAPKKGLKAGVVRPFRSNQDLLAALKRKRQQEHYRVVYEYLFVRFGYPVNLHHQLDLSLDPETGGVGDARSEYNEVTSGDNDPPPKLKPGDHELVTALPVVPEDPPVNDEPVQIQLNKGEPYKNENSRVESIQTVEVKVEPAKVEPVKKAEIKVVPVKVEQIRIVQAKAEPIKAEPAKNVEIKTEQFKVKTVTNVAVKVEPAKVEEFKVNQFKVESVKEEPAEKVEIRVGPVKFEHSKLEPTKVEVKIDAVKVDPVKRETVKVAPLQVDPVKRGGLQPERVKTAESVKIETFRPLEVHNLPVKVEQMNGTTVFTSASYSVSYS